jgi:hypothetical protein
MELVSIVDVMNGSPNSFPPKDMRPLLLIIKVMRRTGDIDIVGHGKSEGIRHHIDHFDYYVQDVLQFVELVSSKYLKVPVFLLGYRNMR